MNKLKTLYLYSKKELDMYMEYLFPQVKYARGIVCNINVNINLN